MVDESRFFFICLVIYVLNFSLKVTDVVGVDEFENQYQMYVMDYVTYFTCVLVHKNWGKWWKRYVYTYHTYRYLL